MEGAGGYYLIVSELVAYKRIDTAVRLFSKTGRRLRIMGDGPEYGSLKSIAQPNVEFRGRVPASELREAYARCRAFLLPGEEDFGIAPVEALASGKAVIALGRGGVLESAPEEDRLGGIFYPEPDEEHLAAAIRRFEQVEEEIDPRRLQTQAARFSEGALPFRNGAGNRQAEAYQPSFPVSTAGIVRSRIVKYSRSDRCRTRNKSSWRRSS